MRLAIFLGAEAEWFPLTPGLVQAVFGPDTCIAVNPSVWTNVESAANAAAWLRNTGAQLLVHALRPDDEYASALVCEISDGHITGVAALTTPVHEYHVAENEREICDCYAGTFIPAANTASDYAFKLQDSSDVRVLITVGSEPFFVEYQGASPRMFFVASVEVADLDAPAGDNWAVEAFSRLVPYAMAIRAVFGTACWRPGAPQATIVVDDPLLNSRYGFLRYDKLLAMTREHNFHVALAFIPYNYRRTSADVVQMFRANSDRLSLCIHGNDHTDAEFAERSEPVLRSLLRIALGRTEVLTRTTGLACDRIMVFPQGRFSVEAMAELRAMNFDAVVNTVVHPHGSSIKLTLGEVAQPAVLRYGGFPLFLRRSCSNTRVAEIAFCFFFGRPVFIVEHHEIFKEPSPMVEAVKRINAVAPRVRWNRLAEVVSHVQLHRIEDDGIRHVRVWARRAAVENTATVHARCLVEWMCPNASHSVEEVLESDSMPIPFIADDAGARVEIDVALGGSLYISLVHRTPPVQPAAFDARHSARTFVRRRLSETRDNYLSRSPRALAVAKYLQKKLRFK